MNEELNIKLKIDTSSVTSSVNKIKNEVANVNKSIQSSVNSSASTDGQVKSTEKLSRAMEKVEKAVNNIKGGISGWDVAKMAVGFKGVEKAINNVKKSTKELGSIIGNLFDGHLSNTISSLFKGEFDSAKINAKEFAFTLKSNLSAAGQRASKAFASFKNGEFGAGIKSLGAALTGGATAGKAFAAVIKTIGAVVGVAATVVGTLTLAIVGLGAALGVVAAFNVSKLGNEIYHTAQRFGFSAEAFQEWNYIMERSGSTMDDLKGFLETLASEQAAVIEGSEDAAANFKRLGMSIDDVVGSNQQELFEETVRRIQRIEDATQRSAIAYSIFGDEASRLMNVLNMNNAEMQEMINNYELLGGGMSDKLIAQSNSLQGSISNMKQAWQGISNTLAEAFIPAVQAVVNWLTKAFVWINLFLRTIFGLDLRTKSSAGSMSGATGSMNKYTGATKAATKAAEALKRTTMGFDELNIVQDPNKSSAASSGGGGAATPGMAGMGDMSSLIPDMSSLNLDGMYAWFEKYKTLIQDITTWSLIIIGVIMIVVGCVGGFNIPLIAAGVALSGLGIAAGMGEGGTWDRWGKAIAKFCDSVITTVKGWIDTLLQKLGEFGTWIYESFIKPIVDFFKAMWDKIVEIFTPIVKWFTELFTSVYKSIKSIIDVIVGLFKGAVLLIQTVWGIVADWFNDKIIKPVSKFFSGMWNGIKSAAKAAWEGIKSVFSPVVNWFKDKFTAAWAGVKKVFSIGGKIFEGIKEGIASVFKTVVNGIIGGINTVIAVPFNAINKLLNKIRSVSVAGIEPFKSFIKYNALSVPQIPKLATGGIATSSILANIGENGKEAVLPLENNTGWMDALADRIAERNSAPSKIVLKIGEKEFAWAAINGINSITRQTGEIQLTL